jgi:hypothetical protein
MLRLKAGLLITLALVLLGGARIYAGPVTGVIDGVYYINGLTVAEGWACDYGRPESIAVHLYAGGPAGTGNFVNAAMANLPSDGAVAAACGSTGSNYRFQIEIGNYQAQNIAKTIFVHGISISGGPNYTLYNSGAFTFPDSIYGTIFGSPYQMRVSKKYAGAIDSFYWRGQHFVNVSDHGREWQIAAQFKGFGECYNPTEAGNLSDEDGPTSSSAFNYLSTYNDVLITRNTPAFWLRPYYYGAPVDYYSSPYCTDSWGGTPYRRNTANTSVLSNYQFTKMVNFGFHGIPNVIWFNIQIYVPENVTSGIQFEAPSGSMPPEFSNFWQFTLPVGNSAHGTWTQLNPSDPNDARWRTQPVVLEKPDPSYPGDSSKGIGVGMYSPDTLNWAPGTNGYFSWTSIPDLSSWSFIYQIPPPGGVSQGTTIFRNTYLVLGTRDEIKAGLESLHCYFTGICP